MDGAVSMTEPKNIEEEAGAEERFDNAVANALKMPPKPHVKVAKKKDGQDKPDRPSRSSKK